MVLRLLISKERLGIVPLPPRYRRAELPSIVFHLVTFIVGGGLYPASCWIV